MFGSQCVVRWRTKNKQPEDTCSQATGFIDYSTLSIAYNWEDLRINSHEGYSINPKGIFLEKIQDQHFLDTWTQIFHDNHAY